MRWRKHVLSVLVLTVFALLGAGSLKTDKEKAEEDKKVENEAASVTVTSQQIFSDYEANEVSADDKYKDKVVAVSGEVTGIEKNPITDAMYIKLATSNQFISVDAYFSDSHKEDLKKAKKGDRVTLKCRCKGMVLSVQLESCGFN